MAPPEGDPLLKGGFGGWRIATGLIIASRVVLGLLAQPSTFFDKYPAGARMLLDGTLTAARTADFSPLYLLLSAALPPMALRFLQAGVVGAMMWGVGWAARNLWGQLAGLVSVLLTALALPIFLYEATLEPDLLSVAGMLLGLVFILRLEHRRKPLDSLWSGVALGIASASRPTGFLALGAVVAYAAHQLRDLPRSFRAFVLLTVAGTGLFIGLLPSLVLRMASHEALGATMSVGEVLQMGNRPESPGLGQQPSTFSKLLELQRSSESKPDEAHEIYRELAAAGGARRTPIGFELFWIGKTWSFLSAEPLAFARLSLRKAGFALLGPDGHDLAQVRRAEATWAGRPWLGTRVLAMIGLAGLVAGFWRRRRVGPILVLLGIGLLVTVVFAVLARYRLPIVCAFCLSGGLFASLAVGEGRARGPFAVLACSAAIAALLPWTFAYLLDGERVLEHAQAASVIEDRWNEQIQSFDWPGATRTFVSLERAQPLVTLTHDLRGIPFERPSLNDEALLRPQGRDADGNRTDDYFLAVLAKRARRCDVALEFARKAEGFRWAMFDHLLEPHLLAAQCQMDRGALGQALTEVRQSLQVAPGTLDGLSAAIALGEANAGATPLEMRSWQAELFALHDSSSARFALAEAELGVGLGARALENVSPVLTAFPDAGVALYVRARALLQLGRTAEALQVYAEALKAFPGHAFETEPFDAAIKSALSGSPRDPDLLALAADQAFRQGDLATAQTFDSRAAAIWGWLTPRSVRERIARYRHTDP